MVVFIYLIFQGLIIVEISNDFSKKRWNFARFLLFAINEDNFNYITL
jgi:hypothetical protein